MRNDYVKVWAPDHPLRGLRGEVLEHRVVLYAAIGPGSHPCHWCQREVTWRVRRGTAPRIDDLVVDHLDGDRANNTLENLVPSCQSCNVSQGYGPTHIQDGEAFRVLSNGNRVRAELLTCPQCGTDFLREPSGVRASGLAYCSRACADAGLRRDVCRRGHERTGANLTRTGACRACQALATQRYRERKRAKG